MLLLKKNKFICGALLLALTILVIGSTYHYFEGGAVAYRFFPRDPHDRRMFLIISSILLGLGFLADRQTRQYLAHEEEKRLIFISTVSAAQHILNNFLNNMLYFQQQAKESHAMDDKTLELYDTVIHDAAEQLKKLGEITEISENNIRKTVYPK